MLTVVCRAPVFVLMHSFSPIDLASTGVIPIVYEFVRRISSAWLASGGTR